MGLAQLQRLETQTVTRAENAAYLKSRLEKIPGIRPYKIYDNVTRVSFHLFPFRYMKEEFKGMPRSVFLKSLNAEGVPCSGGYTSLNDKPYLQNAFQTKNFKRMYSTKELNFDEYMRRNQCPQNDILCEDTGVWFTQNMLLGPQSDMDYIASAIERIRENAEALKKNNGG